MSDQVEAWNKGDLDLFMKGYWQNDSLRFVSSGGVTYGYGNALRRYKDTYNGPDKMGQLFFTLLHVDRLSGEYYFVTGKWFLKRTAGDIGGYYTLLFRKIDGIWKIVEDHTS
jgi:ketosteroid isomerase-like protein